MCHSRKWSSDFQAKHHNNPCYDLIGDYELIEASFAQQYGIRLRLENSMSWAEFSTLLAGLNGETPLGHVVQIRAETNPKAIQKFTPEQKRIRSEWRQRQSKLAQNAYSEAEYNQAMQNLSAMFRTLAK